MTGWLILLILLLGAAEVTGLILLIGLVLVLLILFAVVVSFSFVRQKTTRL